MHKSQVKVELPVFVGQVGGIDALLQIAPLGPTVQDDGILFRGHALQLESLSVLDVLPSAIPTISADYLEGVSHTGPLRGRHR